ncbi:MAG: DMT family transporter [Hyphomicrobiales bacterium]
MLIALSLGIFAALCWSLHDLAARRFAQGGEPYRLAFWVMLAGAVLLAPLVIRNGTLLTAPPGAFATAAAMGLLYGLAIAGLFKAFSLAPVSVVGPFTAGYPGLVVLWAVLQGLMPTAPQWLALVLTLGGAVVVARTGHADGGLNNVKDGKVLTVIMAAVLTSLCFAATVVMGQDAARQMGEIETTFISRGPAALVLLPLMLRERTQAGMQPFDRKVWLGIAAMAGFDVAAVTFINAAGLFPGAAFASVGISFYGAISVFLAMLVLREKVSGGQWGGIAMIVAGIAILGWPS